MYNLLIYLYIFSLPVSVAPRNSYTNDYGDEEDSD